MHLQRGQAGQVGREEQVLHFVGDGQFAFQPLFLLLLGDQLGQRLAHGVEGLLQSGHLVLGVHLDAVRQVATVDVSGCVVEIGDRLGHTPREPDADKQGNQLNEGEEDGDASQHIQEDP